MDTYIILKFLGWRPKSAILKNIEKEMLNKKNSKRIRSICGDAFNTINEYDSEQNEINKFNHWITNMSNKNNHLFKINNLKITNIINKNNYFQVWISNDKCTYCNSICTEKGEIKIEDNRICILR